MSLTIYFPKWRFCSRHIKFSPFMLFLPVHDMSRYCLLSRKINDILYVRIFCLYISFFGKINMSFCCLEVERWSWTPRIVFLLVVVYLKVRCRLLLMSFIFFKCERHFLNHHTINHEGKKKKKTWDHIYFLKMYKPHHVLFSWRKRIIPLDYSR